jgi:hypothetical protein
LNVAPQLHPLCFRLREVGPELAILVPAKGSAHTACFASIAIGWRYDLPITLKNPADALDAGSAEA